MRAGSDSLFIVSLIFNGKFTMSINQDDQLKPFFRRAMS